jgi:transposase InsO family protein
MHPTRFIRTMLNGWAYGAIYGSSQERKRALDGWLWHYNHRRRHSALSHQPPVTRTNVLGSYIYRGVTASRCPAVGRYGSTEA